MKLYEEAIHRVKDVLRRVHHQKLTEPTAMTLATANKKGQPSVRVVLLKDVDEKGFVFYTNLNSRKAKDLSENPWAALCLFWDPLDDQIRVEGRVEKVSKEEADAYWASRSRDSQIGGWASLQSAELTSRSILMKRVAQFALKFGFKPIPRPPHWSGFRVVPHKIELWVRKPFRLHQRTIYELSGRKWKKKFLFP